MEKSVKCSRGMVVTPHHLATQSAVAILREGGTAIEAMVAAAATIAVVYPHMNSIGGDGFWLIIPPIGDPIVIEACGAAGSLVNPALYEGLDIIPFRGPKSAITVAGTVGGWQAALDYVTECGYQKISTSRLLADAITYAENGFPISEAHDESLKRFKLDDDVLDENVSSEFQRVFLKNGKLPKAGEMFYQNNLAKTFRHLSDYGLNSFYKGELAKLIVDDMKSLGMPITETDLLNYSTVKKEPLRLKLKSGEVFNLPPPTQGLVSLTVLGILEEIDFDGKHDGEFIHTVVEATKQAFILRDEFITDPTCMKVDPRLLVSSERYSSMAKNINPNKASSLGKGKGPGDTVWMGIMDNKGFSVSFIQSVYHEFGSSVLLPKTGILWHNRGIAFSLDENHILSLKPGKKPFHTLNPAAARLNDGRIMVYGTRGGDGQSQTQATIFHRHVIQGMPLQASITAPRWVYGRNDGVPNDKVQIENRFSNETIRYLKERGHDIVVLPPFSINVGQAGALVRHPNGVMEGAFDPRSDGSAAGF